MILLSSDDHNAHFIMSVAQVKALALALAQLEVSQLRDAALLLKVEGYPVNEGTVASLIAEFHFSCRDIIDMEEMVRGADDSVPDMPIINPKDGGDN